MNRKSKPISEQLRQAILNADKTRYRIAKETDVTEGQLSKFIHSKAKLTLDSIDRIGECLALELTTSRKPVKRKGR